MNDNMPTPTPQEKLTDWAKEPQLRSFKGDLELAKPAHDSHVRRIDKWNNLLNVTGEFAPKKVHNRSSVQPKLVRRQAEWRYPALSEPFLSSPQLFKINPVTFEDKKAAEQNALVLNYQFRTKLNRIKLIDDYVHSTVDDGTCIVRLGWERRTKKVKQQAPQFSFYEITAPEQGQMLEDALNLKSENPRAYEEGTPPEVKAAADYFEETGQAVFAVQTGTAMVDVDKIIVNRPTVEIMNPRNVWIDPSCGGDLDKAMFLAISFETSQAELKKSGKNYKNLEAVNWEGATPITEPDHETSTPTDFNFTDALRKRVVAYEYWGYCDIHGKGELTPIVATWIGNTLIRLEESPFTNGLPFVVVPYLPIKRELMGEPDAEVLEDNQKVLGAVTRGVIDLMGKSANGQQGFAKGMLDALNRRRYDQGQDYEFNPNFTPATHMTTHTYPEIPQSAMLMMQLQNQEAEALTGVKAYSGGISGESYGDVAAGVRGAMDAASKREMSILRRLAKGMADIGTKIMAMNQQFLSDKEVIRITNEEFITVSREDLEGQFDMEVDINTAEVDDAKAKDLGFMLQTLGPNMDSGITMMILADIAKLKQMPELSKKLETYKPQPDPVAQQLQQLELQKTQTEIQKLQSEIQLNTARAQQAMAQANQQQLDSIEQETGTTHARDMQKQQAQSIGNQHLQVTKALTAPRKEGESAPDITAAIGYNQLSDNMSKAGQPEPAPVSL